VGKGRLRAVVVGVGGGVLKRTVAVEAVAAVATAVVVVILYNSISYSY